MTIAISFFSIKQEHFLVGTYGTLLKEGNFVIMAYFSSNLYIRMRKGLHSCVLKVNS